MAKHSTLGLLAVAMLLATACGADDEPTSASGSPGDDSSAPADGTIVAHDNEGREIVLDGPVERAVVINGYANEYVQAIDAQGAVVGADQSSIDRLPYIDFPADGVVGQDYSALNYEKIISLDPEIVVLPVISPWQDAEAQLAPFDIQVAVITAYQADLLDENVEFLGQIFGKEERAAELLAFRDEMLDLVSERVEGEPAKKVYYEDSAEPYRTYGPSSGYDLLITLSGNENLADELPALQEPQTVEPATVLSEQPDIVLKEVENSYEPLDQSVYDDVIADFRARPGWNDLLAMANEEVYIVNGWVNSALSKTLGTLYLATWSHPEAFADVDPDEYLRRWAVDFQQADFDSADDYIVKAGS